MTVTLSETEYFVLLNFHLNETHVQTVCTKHPPFPPPPPGYNYSQITALKLATLNGICMYIMVHSIHHNIMLWSYLLCTLYSGFCMKNCEFLRQDGTCAKCRDNAYLLPDCCQGNKKYATVFLREIQTLGSCLFLYHLIMSSWNA